MCEHVWRDVHEAFLLGGSFSVGFRCTKCNQFVRRAELTPAGLPGVVDGSMELVGPHGGRGNCADGSQYTKQVKRSDGRLEIHRPDGAIDVT